MARPARRSSSDPGDGETPAQAPAYALTNGHCVDLFDATSVVRDGQPTPGAGGVAFGVAADGSPVAEASVASIRWATMKGTDLAVIELDTTLADLEAKGVVAYPIADAVAPGTPVVVVGGPASTDGSDRTLRLGACTSGPPKDLFEWRWTWFGFPSSDCADIRAGSSGSPVFDPTTGSVVALVNTTTQGSGDVTDCSMGRPCEVTDEARQRQGRGLRAQRRGAPRLLRCVVDVCRAWSRLRPGPGRRSRGGELDAGHQPRRDDARRRLRVALDVGHRPRARIGPTDPDAARGRAGWCDRLP
ncbi:MAG: serine protease [Chloroflexota bacterium]